MDKEKAKLIVNAGKEVLEVFANDSGADFFSSLLANWDVIEAFAGGDTVRYKGEIAENFSFKEPRGCYEIIAREINWRNVVENGGLGIAVMATNNCQYVLVGVSHSTIQGNNHYDPIVKPRWVPQAGPFDIQLDVAIMDKSLIQDSWYG